jgi:hypothetical protein
MMPSANEAGTGAVINAKRGAVVVTEIGPRKIVTEHQACFVRL